MGPIFFAYEDRDQITILLAETYCHLADAASVYLDKVVKPSQLREQTGALMTDSVSKNLKIEGSIAASINSTHFTCYAKVIL